MNSADKTSTNDAARSFLANPGVVRLVADVQHYAWGDPSFIPILLGIENREQEPFAELWMGAHPDLPSLVVLDHARIPLNELTDHAADQILGPAVATKFKGRLPYLFKVLSAAAPLSIQAHPTKPEAEAGFARENADGIALSDKTRNYKDDNHKPELIAALTDFYALRGFRPYTQIGQVLRETPELRDIMPDYQPNQASLRALYEQLMTMPQQEVNAILDPLVQRLAEADKQHHFTREDREYWVLRADRTFSRAGCRDRGLFSVLLLNLVHLRPGQALYLSAGVLHAYLEGSGMEIMANSNNVLRGGLTPKHVDVPELIRNLIFDGDEPEILEATPIKGKQEWTYRTPVREFELRRIDVTEIAPFCSDGDHSADILILVDQGQASVTVKSDTGTLLISKGDVLLAPAGIEYSIETTGKATIYKATVPCQ
jgi:mannose-6-phosphate isomerase